MNATTSRFERVLNKQKRPYSVLFVVIRNDLGFVVRRWEAGGEPGDGRQFYWSDYRDRGFCRQEAIAYARRMMLEES